MPITGIPMVLENILESVLKTHNLKTWNLFYEENGDISFRLRLSNMENVHTTPDIGSHSTESFRRKSYKQITRDKDRALKRRRISSHSNKDIEVQRGYSSESDCSYEGPKTDIPSVTQETSIISTPGTVCKSSLTPPPTLDFDDDKFQEHDDTSVEISAVTEATASEQKCSDEIDDFAKCMRSSIMKLKSSCDNLMKGERKCTDSIEGCAASFRERRDFFHQTFPIEKTAEIENTDNT